MGTVGARSFFLGTVNSAGVKSTTGLWRPTGFHRRMQVPLVARFWRFSSSVEDLQVAMICVAAMALLAGRLANHAELHHVLQSFRHSGCRQRKPLRCRRDRDNRLALEI
jgi:hypothetical protein